MLEEEYYTSQGVHNTKSYFETPNGKLFTQSFLPLDLPVKATVFMTHGYGSWRHGEGRRHLPFLLPQRLPQRSLQTPVGFLIWRVHGRRATTMLMYFQSEPNTWTGLIFSTSLFVMPENMKPSKVWLFMYGLLFRLADTWASMPDNKMVGKHGKMREEEGRGRVLQRRSVLPLTRFAPSEISAAS